MSIEEVSSASSSTAQLRVQQLEQLMRPGSLPTIIHCRYLTPVNQNESHTSNSRSIH